MMGFTEAVRSVVVERYADFQGRSPRSEFWWFALFYMLLSLGVGMIAAVSDTLGGILNLVVTICLLVPSLAVSIRRLHDTDRTGWWILLYLIPVIGTIVLIVFYVQRGTDGDNRFGPDPLGNVVERFA
jgi:uncharacterized membrane protein YhaH (DUF805 family)